MGYTVRPCLNIANVLAVLRGIRRKNENMVKVDLSMYVQNIAADIVHEMLEGAGA